MKRAIACACAVAALLAGCGGSVDTPRAAGGDAGDAAAATPPPTGAPSPADAGAPVADASTPGPDLTTIPELAECLASDYELHATTTGGSVFPAGVFGIDGTKGNWSGRVTGQSTMQLDIASGWSFDWHDFVASLKPGAHVVGERDPGVGVNVGGEGCSGQPGDTFTVVAFASSGGDQASLTHLVAFFDLTCARSGKLRGCVRYGH